MGWVGGRAGPPISVSVCLRRNRKGRGGERCTGWGVPPPPAQTDAPECRDVTLARWATAGNGRKAPLTFAEAVLSDLSPRPRQESDLRPNLGV